MQGPEARGPQAARARDYPRKLELDGRREIGVIINDRTVVRKIRSVFEADWKLS